MSPYLALFQHEFIHFTLSIIAGMVVIVIFTRRTKDKKGLYARSLIGGFLGEFFIDADHLFDYVVAYGFNFRLDYFLKGYMFDKLHKSFVPLHAWEWVALLLFIVYVFKNSRLRPFLLAVALGMFLHLVYDTYYNHFLILGYSIVYRAIHQFDLRYITR